MYAARNRYLTYLELLLIAYGAFFIAVMGFKDYSMRLFLVGPLIFGAIVVTVVRRYPHGDYPTWFKAILYTVVVPPLSLAALLSIMMLASGFEGLICIAMALPIVLGPLLVGAALAFWVEMALTKDSRMLALLWLVAVGLVGLLIWNEAYASNDGLLKVTTSIEIDAPPETVWENVVRFSDLPDPDEFLFQTGIAYPIRARIDGEGVGAIRYCEFTTGPFVEPITVWDAPHKLAFDVTECPEPMKEVSPWGEIHPPHLDGYMVSEKGQFVLTELPDGSTLLEGTTWYRHGLGPERYWTLWSDWIIHKIHLRVLHHIKVLSEGDIE